MVRISLSSLWRCGNKVFLYIDCGPVSRCVVVTWYSDHCDSAAARVWVRSQCSTIITGALFVTEKERRLISIRARELWLVTVIASCRRLLQLLNLHTFKFGIFAFTRSVKAAPPCLLAS